MNPPLRLVVSMDDQRLKVWQGDQCVREFVISTALKGMGFTKDSYRTPTGRFRICGKIGDGEEIGTIFKSRVPVGLWRPGENLEDDLILTRILRLEGLDAENRNTLERCIYIHGTNREELLGEPSSHGCIRLSNAGMIELFDMVSDGTPVEILPATRRRGRLLFIACDSTLSAINGLHELARLRGDEMFCQVCRLTSATMDGGMPIHDALEQAVGLIRPDRAMCEQVAGCYVRSIVPGALDFIQQAKQAGWLPVILSGGFAPVIAPLARRLGIEHVEAVPLSFDEDGSYAEYGREYPTTRNFGKNEVIREWGRAMQPERIVMIGAGLADLETSPDVDLFIGFNGVIDLPGLANGCHFRIPHLGDCGELLNLMSGNHAVLRMP